jgi:hypothetical protein
MTRALWLSFCDTEKPQGQLFLGVAVVDVTPDDVAEAARLRPAATEEGHVIAAALRKHGPPAATRAGKSPRVTSPTDRPRSWPSSHGIAC